MKKYFGTDGIRGVANQDLTPELVFRIGRAAAAVLSQRSNSRILIGKDPRLSSDMLEAALVSGILSAGVKALRCGIVPTPAVSYLTRRENAEAGIMISASHNPVEHNGIKIFGKNGHKLSDKQEKEIESRLRSKTDSSPRPIGLQIPTVEELPEARPWYLEHLRSFFPHSLAGLHLVLDCAYGATSLIAPELFRSLGAKVSAHCDTPDGSKINLECGATHLEFIQNTTLADRGDLGMAFDGDGDRVIFVTREGAIFNGDGILAALALDWKKSGKLRGPVVTTVMANFGLEEAFHAEKIPMVRTAVGDRFVLEEMIRQNSNLGGEQSGHIILLDHEVTGDGCLTALHLLSTMAESGKALHELGTLVKEFPQLLVNVPVRDLSRFKQDGEIKRAIEAEASLLKGRGRIVVRPSGTEPLVRVMAEGPDAKELREVVTRVAGVIEKQMTGGDER